MTVSLEQLSDWESEEKIPQKYKGRVAGAKVKYLCLLLF
jgi:hypothetical protein